MGFIPLLALMAVGTAAKMAGAKKAKKSMTRNVNAELARQNNYAMDSEKVFRQSLADVDVNKAKNEVATGQQSRQAAYDKVGAMPMAAGVARPEMSTAMSDRTGARTSMDSGNQAAVQGMSDWQIQQMLRQIRANEALNMYGNFAQGSARVNPYEIADASRAGDNWNAGGDLAFSLASMVGGGAGGGASGLTGAQSMVQGLGPLSKEAAAKAPSAFNMSFSPYKY